MPATKRDVAWKLKVAATIAVLIVSGTAALGIIFDWLDIQTQAKAATEHEAVIGQCTAYTDKVVDMLERDANRTARIEASLERIEKKLE